jgi:hypothetical protein
MTLIQKAAALDVPVLLAAVAIEIDPTRVLAWVAGGFFALLALLVQREWARHDQTHATVDLRLMQVEARIAKIETRHVREDVFSTEAR